MNKSAIVPSISALVLSLLSIAAFCGVSSVEPAPPPGMVLIPAGEFTMGGQHHPDEAPVLQASTDAVYMDVYEVTNADYKKFIDATKYPAPLQWRNNTYSPGQDKLPVVNITWYDAAAYAEWAGKRLPTETEWEKAARGTDGRLFPWGDEKPTPELMSNNHTNPTPVGSFPAGTSPYGCHDMAGNAWEWTASWYTPYPGNAAKVEGFGEQYKVIRGGCFDMFPQFNRATFRGINLPTGRTDMIGFRCAMSVKKQ